MNLGDTTFHEILDPNDYSSLDLSDRWILSRLTKVNVDTAN